MRKLRPYLVLLCTALTVVLTGCSPKEQAQSQVVSSGEGPSWTWDTSPLTISWFVTFDWYSKNWDVEQNIMDKMVTDATGISVEVSSGPVEKLNAMIAAGKLPDVITMDKSESARKRLEDAGQLLSLDDLAAQYAPDFAYPQSMANWFRNEKTGKWYAFSNYYTGDDTKKPGDFSDTHSTWYARKDIMDQLGIGVADFDTIEGLAEALRKVKQANIKYDGLDVVPFLNRAGAGTDDMRSDFGFVAEDTNGDFVDYRRTPAYLANMKFLNKLIQEGFMPKENLSMDVQTVGEWVENGRVFLLSGWASMSNSMKALASRDPNVLFVPVGPPKAGGVEQVYLPSVPSTGWAVTAITKSAKDPARIIRFFNYLATDEMSISAYYSVKGVAWDVDSDGNLYRPEAYIQEVTANPALEKTKYFLNFDWFVNWLPIQRLTKNKGTDAQDTILQKGQAYFGQYSYETTAFDATPAKGSDEAALAAKLNTFWGQREAELVLAKDEATVEKEWQAGIAEMDQLGWQKWYDAVNGIFHANKDKMKISFAHPANR